MGAPTPLEIEDLWKAYGELWAVRALSLQVEVGEIVGLVGPNGAGKTTTLKTVVGLAAKDRGRIRVHGMDADEESQAYKAHFGYLPEAPSMPDYLSAQEFLGYVARLRGVPLGHVEERVAQSLASFGLTSRAGDNLGVYSKGMKQRLALASSLIHRPELLIWDEPFLGVDPAGQHQVKTLLRDYVTEGRAALVSTHVLETAERLCHRVIILHHGHVVAQGGLESLRGTAALGQGSSLEEVFLKLTQEEGEEEPTTARHRRWWGGR